MRPAPENQLPRSAVRAWRISSVLVGLLILMVPVFLWLLGLGEDGPPRWLAYGLAGAVAVCTGVWTLLIPEIRWRRWRYQVDEHEIDLRRGAIIISRTLVPANRVQHVDTRQGPILRNYGLADVTISTAATTHKIPALDEETAELVRDRISQFARLAQEDV
ncbi:MAG: PH domain-containing protein [Balneolaceae bacterium]|nr:PH domain-containing protein [Balneolaceae bacterium]